MDYEAELTEQIVAQHAALDEIVAALQEEKSEDLEEVNVWKQAA